jgi:AcrR family transcriptional regulator
MSRGFVVDYTPYKKEMTYRMISAYCRDMHGTPSGELCPGCKEILDRSVAHLDACRFKEEGRPCPSCPDCCMSKEDYAAMVLYINHDAKQEDVSVDGNATTAIRGVDDVSEIGRRYDARYETTKVRIKGCFMDMIAETGFQNITVSALCRKAEIGRNTFYAHYEKLVDVADDCFFDLSLMTDFMPSQVRFSRWVPKSCGRPLCLLLREDKRFQALMFDPYLEERGMEILASTSMPRIIHTFTARTYMDLDDMRTTFRFSLAGCLKSIKDNLDKSDEEWAKIKKTIDLFNLGGLRLLVQE